MSISRILMQWPVSRINLESVRVIFRIVCRAGCFDYVYPFFGILLWLLKDSFGFLWVSGILFSCPGYLFGGEVLRFFHGGDECLTIPSSWSEQPGQKYIPLLTFLILITAGGNSLGFSGILWDPLGSSGILWDHLGSSGTMKDLLKYFLALFGIFFGDFFWFSGTM